MVRAKGHFLSTKGLSGHDLRNANLQNRILRELRRRLERPNQRPVDSLALLVAETRALTLKMTRKEFAERAGMHKHAVQNAETPGSHPQHESMSRIYRIWETLKVPEANKIKLLELLVPETDGDGRPLRPTVQGLYRKWIYQKGQKAFEAASRRTNRQRQTLSYGTLWQRHEVDMAPDFEEVRIIGKQLGYDLQEARAIWAIQRMRQLLERGVDEILARFLVQVELSYEGLRMNERSLRRRLNITHNAAKALTHGEMPALRDVAALIAEVVPRRDRAAFRKEWQEKVAATEARETFCKAFERIRDRDGWTNEMISKLLKIRAPEKRKTFSQPKKQRKEPYRPSAELRRMYKENGFSSQAPAKVVIEFVARDPQENEYLTSLFIEGLTEHLRKQGSGLQDSIVRKHRILCGVSAEQVTSVSRFTRDEILLIEQGKISLSPSQARKLLEKINVFPMEKVYAARREQGRLADLPKTVQEAVTLLAERHGSYSSLARLLRDEDDSAQSVTLARLKRIGAGKEVPPLPLLKRVVTRGGSAISPELIRDWYKKMPEYLSTHRSFRWRHPMARGVGILLLEKARSLRDFWEQRLRGDFEYSILTRNIQQLNGRGYSITWPSVSRYLNAAGLRLQDPRRRYLEALFEVKEEITAGLNKRPSAVPQVVQQVLRKWRRQVRRQGKDPQECEHRLGLTARERGLNGSR